MLRKVFSYFWRPSNESELSLEGACSILKEELVDNDATNDVFESKPTNSFSVRTGTVTKCDGNNCVIDDQYIFYTDKETFAVGSRVSYDYYICDNTENIANVHLVNSDWEPQLSYDTLWNTRIIIAQVVQRIDRNLILSPENITVDLDNTSIEFLPVVGDWLELDVKCSVNENSLNLRGQIIEINKISPVRELIDTGTVTKWDGRNQNGIINKNIYFNKFSLSSGYVPINGDKVTVQAIESDQNRCSWRALKVIPESITKFKSHFNTPNLMKSEDQDHPGLCIDVPELSFTSLNESRTFFVTISNISEENVVLLNAAFSINSQCKILDKIESPKVISKIMSHKLSCECIARNVGDNKELLLLSFESFDINKWINVNVTINYKRTTNKFERKSKLPCQSSSKNQLVRGQRVNAPRFIATQLPNYAIPQKLLDIVSKCDYGKILMRDELNIEKPSLFSNLTYNNYEDKFHNLLYLEEISNLIMIRNYDQEKACFIANEDYLMLEIENLAERRPSIVLGDKIIATDPLSKSGVDFEGYVHKVGAKHIYIKFSKLFHDKYGGEDYSIKVVPSRSSYRKLHHAVHLALRNLGKDILFPTRLYEKEPQVDIVFDENYSDICGNDISDKRKINPSNVLDKLIQIKNTNEQAKVDINPGDMLLENKHLAKLKLEWYNNALNSQQKDAVVNVLLGIARPLPYIIFGPPGTGKTVTLVELVLQIIRLIPHSRLLITAASNSASDLIAMRLIQSGVLKPGDLVRLVSYNYALSDLIPITLVPYCATASQARDGTTDHDITHAGIQFESSRASLGRHRITVSTCSTSGQLYSMGFPKGHFSHIIVDEAAQASEPNVLIPLAFLDKSSGQVVLAGDPMQLGPVILSNLAVECGLGESYLERLCCTFPYSRDPEGFYNNNGYDPRLVTKLLHNYRSLPSILKLTSSLFYDDELISTIDDESSTEARLCCKLKDILPKNRTKKIPRVVFHGVNGANYQTADSPSWYNPHEVSQVFYYINEFYRMGLSAKQIGIITPYIKQVKEIRALLVEAEFDIPKIGTVEEFQGQEFDVIVLSTVRSCEEFISSDILYSLGFVSSPRRLNVAISRPKALLLIIGNPKLLCHDIYWRSVIKYCFEEGAYTGCDFSL